MNKALLLIGLLLLTVACRRGITPIPLAEYGELYHHNESATVFSIPSSGTYYNLTLLDPGELRGITVANSVFSIRNVGVYAAQWHLSFSGGGGKEYEVTVLLNNVEQVKCEGYRKLGNAGDVGNMGGTCLLSLAQNDTLALAVESVSNPAADINVYTSNFNVVKI